MMTHLLFDFWNVLAFADETANKLILNHRLIDFVKTLTIPCHVFSNTPAIALAKVQPQLIPPFSSILSAQELQLSKSRSESYQRLAQLFDTSPQQILFTDDQQHNIAAARSAGLQVILFEDTDQFIRTVTKLLI